MFMSTRAGIFTVAALVACVSLAQGVVSRPISEAPAGTVESRPLSLAKSEAAGAQACAFAFIPMLETPAATWEVTAFRFNLLIGSHHSVRGFDLGLLANMTDYELSGFALAGLFNDCGLSDGAFTVAGVFNHASWNYKGLQLAAALNDSEGAFTGVQVALCNYTPRLSGLQVGAVNVIERGRGLQVGVVNTSDVLYGAQIGVINIITHSSVPFLPVFNCAF